MFRSFQFFSNFYPLTFRKRHKSAPSEVPTTCNGPSIDTNKSDQIKETTPDLHISTNDIGFVKQSTRKLTNEEKFNLIRNHFQPGINYNFPIKKNMQERTDCFS